jgi:hypothetical protein
MFLNFMQLFFQQILGSIAYNVPAVYDVFASPIKETVGFQGLQKCGGEKTHKGHRPTAFFRSPRALLRPKHIQSCYVQCARILLSFIQII